MKEEEDYEDEQEVEPEWENHQKWQKQQCKKLQTIQKHQKAWRLIGKKDWQHYKEVERMAIIARQLATKFTRVFDNTPIKGTNQAKGFKYKIKGTYGPFFTRKQAEKMYKKIKWGKK